MHFIGQLHFIGHFSIERLHSNQDPSHTTEHGGRQGHVPIPATTREAAAHNGGVRSPTTPRNTWRRATLATCSGFKIQLKENREVPIHTSRMDTMGERLAPYYPVSCRGTSRGRKDGSRSSGTERSEVR